MMAFATKRIETTHKIAVPRIKRWIATNASAIAAARRERWLMKQRLIAKAQDADLGKTIDTRGMSDDQFVALLRR